MRLRPQLAALSLCVLLAAPAAHAVDYVVIPHVGRLITSGETGQDVPVDGVRKLKFGLYRKSTDPAGENNLVWEQDYRSVEVRGGFYQVDLGDTSAGGAPLELEELAGAPYFWLEVTVYENDSDTSGVKLTPRMRLAQAYAAVKANDALRLGGREAAEYSLKDDLDAFRSELTGGTGSLSVPWSKISEVPPGLAGFGAASVDDFTRKSEFEEFRAALTGGGAGGVSVPWNRVSDVPSSVTNALQQVATTGTSLTGFGTGASPLAIADQGIDTAQLKDGAVTALKLATGAVSPNVFQDGSLPPAKLATCPEGQLLKMQSGTWQCGADIGGGATLPFDVLAPLEQVAGSGGSSAKLQVKDNSIPTAKLADGAVDAAKLKDDDASLGAMSGGVLNQTEAGAIGVGAAAPTARLEVAPFADAGVAGVGSIAPTAANATTFALVSGTFEPQVRPGDLFQVGNLGWRLVVSVAADGKSLVTDAGYSSVSGNSYSVRHATLRLGAITETALGTVAIGAESPAPAAALEVASRTGGLLPPRMTSAERKSISSPVAGLLVFDTTAGTTLQFTGTRWQEVGASPIGSIEAWHKSLSGTPSLPWGWVQCDGQTLADGDSPLNGQVIPNLNGGGRFLRGGTTSGTLQDDQFQTHAHANDLATNGGGSVTTGTESAGHTHSGTTGTVSADHSHRQYVTANNGNQAIRRDFSSDGGSLLYDQGMNTGGISANHTHSFTTGGVSANHTHNVPAHDHPMKGGVKDPNSGRYGGETRPTNMSVVWIMRVK